jgi:hypothetical protein
MMARDRKPAAKRTARMLEAAHVIALPTVQ